MSVDPDAALAALRAAIADYIAAKAAALEGVEANDAFEDTPESAELADQAVHAADDAIVAMIGLDSWLSMGGFLPSAWRATRNGHRQSPDANATESDATTDQEGGS